MDDVFSDSKRSYGVEGTPAQISRATSLSDLSFDLSDMNLNTSLETSEPEKENGTGNRMIVTSTKAQVVKCVRRVDRGKPPPIPPKPIHLQKKPMHNNGTTKIVGVLVKCPKIPPPPECAEETMQVFYTEDTPAVLSHATSISDLSIIGHDEHLLSLSQSVDTSHRASPCASSDEEEDEDGEDYCEDDGNLLEQCISSGMPSKVSKPDAIKEVVEEEKGDETNDDDDEISSSEEEGGEEGDDKILEQCIAMGMQSKRTTLQVKI